MRNGVAATHIVFQRSLQASHRIGFFGQTRIEQHNTHPEQAVEREPPEVDTRPIPTNGAAIHQRRSVSPDRAIAYQARPERCDGHENTEPGWMPERPRRRSIWNAE